MHPLLLDHHRQEWLLARIYRRGTSVSAPRYHYDKLVVPRKPSIHCLTLLTYWFPPGEEVVLGDSKHALR